MKALWLEGGKVELRDVPIPEPGAGESLIRVLTAGICNTDLEMMRGYRPFSGVLGHEFVGRVQQGPPELEGRRVVGEINDVCGSCVECTSGRKNHCSNRTVLGILNRNGVFAEYVTLPSENLYAVRDRISNEEAVFTEPLAAALEVQEQVAVLPDDRVLVVGAGKLGQLVARSLALPGAQVTVLDRNPEKLALLKPMGVRGLTTIEEMGRATFDLAVECTGNPSGFEIALHALRPRGTLVLKSTYRGNLTHDASRIVVNEITLIGSRCGPFDKALALLADREVTVTDLISARYPLEAGLDALEEARKKGALKVVIAP